MNNVKSRLPGVLQMSHRLHYEGGEKQQERMIKDKRWSLNHAVKYSYQGAQVKKVGENATFLALINPNKLKPDYDDKVLSIGYEANFQPGDVFEWCGTKTKWLIYLQNLTEVAYFRADIRKCSYEVKYLDKDGNEQLTYLALRGPVETKIESIQKEGIRVDVPNYSVNFLIPKNESTLNYFKRYARFYIQETGTTPVCWRVEAVDYLSMPGVIQINAIEYYGNKTEDDIENGIANAWTATSLDKKDDPSNIIVGDGFIKPKCTYTYTYEGFDVPHWSIDSKYPIEKTINKNKITIKWTKTYSGQFTIKCNNESRVIVVESLF